ncbi:MAG: Bcr/CflA family multidrug efflux MFS transporter [Chitinophagaceae bacterium]
MKGRKKFFMIVILGMLSAIGPFSIDMYLPGFPAIAADLHTTVARVALSLSSFFIGISVGQLLYGPLLDRYGRKKPLYIGLSVYLLASIGCALATSANALIALRFIQALGGCAGMVAARAMVRDIFPVEENAKIFSMLMLVIGVSPIIAPTLGGYVTAAFGWHYIFIILTIMSVLILVAVHFALPESRKPDLTVSLLPAPIIKSFLSVFKEPQFYTYAFTGAISAAGLYAYISGSPHVFMELYKVTEQQYGWIFAGVALGLITCSQLNSFLLRRFKSEQIIPVALFCQTIAGIVLVLGTAFQVLGLTSTIFFILIFLSCQGFVFPNSSALTMAPFGRNAGTASALMGAIQLAIGALTSGIVSVLTSGTALPMAGVMASCALVSLFVLMAGKKMIRYNTTPLQVQEENAEMMSTL